MGKQLRMSRSNELEKRLKRIEKLIETIRRSTDVRPDEYAYFDMAEIHSIAADFCDQSNHKVRLPDEVALIDKAHENLVDAIEEGRKMSARARKAERW